MFPAKSVALLALVLAGQDQNTSPDRFARELLKRAAESSLSATPVVASASLLRIGALTANWSREDGIKYMEAALQMSAAIPPEDARQVGGNIASQSAALLAEFDLQRGLELIARTAPGQRSSLLAVIVQRMLETKQYAAACDALHQFGFDRPTGYRLISKALKLTPLSEDRRSLLLGRSSVAFQSDPNTEFGALLRENAEGFPDSVLVDPVRSYVRWLLSAHPGGQEQERISVASAKGEAAFASQYELELYRMIPLVIRLDSALVARIYENSPGVKAVMERYPDGLEVAGGGGISLSSVRWKSGAAPASAGVLARTGGSSQLAAIEAAKTDPAKALSLAAELQSPRARAMALAQIAGLLSASDPLQASRAIDLSLRELKAVENPEERVGTLSLIADAARRAGQTGVARDVILRGIQDAMEVYKLDNNEKSINMAPRTVWPSFHYTRRLAHLAGQVLGPEAANVIAAIQDPELHLAASIELAAALLNQEPAKSSGISINRVKR